MIIATQIRLFAHKITFWIGIIVGISLTDCSFSAKGLKQERDEYLTDSLIRVKPLCEKVVLICLGPDAITAINTKNGIVVVDAGISESLTAKYRRKIENSFKSKVFIYLINTHGHPDHTGGNRVFADATIIGHENCGVEMEKQWENPKKNLEGIKKTAGEYTAKLEAEPLHSTNWEYLFTQKMRYQHAYTDALQCIPLTKPEVAIQKEYEITAGEYTFEVLYFGKAHSESDLLLFVPALRMMFTGDLFGQYGSPFFDDSASKNAGEWLNTLKWLTQRLGQTDIVIGGHGLVMERKDLQSFIDIVGKKRE